MSDHEPRTLHEELEIRVIALLTGELPETEAEELEKILGVDEPLAEFRDRMAVLMGDIHNARDEIAPPSPEQDLKLSEERRRVIFETFEPVKPVAKEDDKKWWHLSLLEIAAMLLVGAFIAALLIPSVGAVRQKAQSTAEQADARAAEIERNMFALETSIPRELIEGTPQPVRLPALAKVSPPPPPPPSTLRTQTSLPRPVVQEMPAQAKLSGETYGSSRVDNVVIELEDINTGKSYGKGMGGGFVGFNAAEPKSRVVAQPMLETKSESSELAMSGLVDMDNGAAVDPFAAPAAPRSSRMRQSETASRPVDYFAAPAATNVPVDAFAPSASSPRSREKAKKLKADREPAEMMDDYFANAGDISLGVNAAVASGSTSSQSRAKDEGLIARGEMLKEFDMDGGFFEKRAPILAEQAAPTVSDKLNRIVIPQVNFSGMPLSKVLETLEELSVEYDSEERGVALSYNQPENGADPRVNISLRNLSMDRILQFVTQQVNYSYDVAGNKVLIQPAYALSNAERTAIARNKLVSQAPKPEKQTLQAPISTFSLNVSDVSFKLAQAALESRRIPDPELIRSEEFVNSFSYGDPAPREDEPVALNWEIAQHPYEHNRQIVRFSLQTQAAGRASNQALNLNVLLDNSGSMQRPDRRAILEQSLQALQGKLTDRDQLNIILFARQPKLIARAGSTAAQQAAVEDALQYQPEGGTNLEAGLQVAYETAHQHYDPTASNRVILMTDGAANLGDVDASALSAQVVEQRKQGIALDAYGIGWEDYNDALLEEITRNGDGRYAFLNSADTAAEDFAEKLAGTLRVAAADVKVQILWNPERVTSYRQIGYDLHQLKAQDFRDNTVDAAEIGKAESGTALYVLKINDDPDIIGGLGTLQVRYRVPATGEYVERAWPLEMPRQIPALQDATPSLRLAATSAFFAERLADNPYAANYSFEDLEALTADLPQAFPAQPRVAELQNMIQSAHALFN